MTYSESVKYLYSLGNEVLAMKLGLDTMRALAAACGNPHRSLPVVHIAGTNGKGSTAAMSAAIAESAGFRTGLYTSPHLVDITERIQIDGRQISQYDFARLATQVREASVQLVELGELPALPTFFEQVTAIAFIFFAEQRVDLAILEVGLGGRLDATNICEPLVTAITSVSLDHQHYLGDTLESIAAEKAGIIKPAIPVISAQQKAAVADVIAERSLQLGSMLVTEEKASQVGSVAFEDFGRYRFRCETSRDSYDIALRLRGRHQIGNARVALLIAEHLNIAREAIEAGLGRAEWPGRLELIAGRPRLLLDGAHNADGAENLRAFLDEHGQRPLTMIFGAMSDKAITEIAGSLFSAADLVIATRIDNPRAARPETIREAMGAFAGRIKCAESVREALAMAQVGTLHSGLVCACGSLYLIGEIKALLQQTV
jgi:dihydrofolate synthase / folylpolyglutamate synthase